MFCILAIGQYVTDVFSVSNIERKRVNGSVLYDNLNIPNKNNDFTKIYEARG